MGVDWFRVRPKASTDLEELRSLIDRQATAFQSITWYWMSSPLDLPTDSFLKEEKVWSEEFLSSSKRLAEQFEQPPYDAELGHCLDIADLDPCRSTFSILGNPIFPPQWARDGARTYLADELLEQVAVWQNWIHEVSRGKHRGYLLQLWAYQESMMLYQHWRTLQQFAQEAVGELAPWTQKTSFQEACDKVFQIWPPTFHPAPTLPHYDYAWTDILRSRIEETIEDLVALTREWDTCVDESYKVRYYNDYHYSFDEFIEQGTGKVYMSNLEWAARCGSLGFGLYLDY
ncbi:MAG: hypothetical protein PVH19_09730 [Planctomycetia bacterium]|jgi:hypothetical protein